MRLGKCRDAGEIAFAELEDVVADRHEPSKSLQCAGRRGAEGAGNPARSRVVGKTKGLHALLGTRMKPDLTAIGHDRENARDVEAAFLTGGKAALRVA